jgi:hypothetical protein
LCARRDERDALLHEAPTQCRRYSFEQQHEQAGIDMASHLVPMLQELVNTAYCAALRNDEHGRAVEQFPAPQGIAVIQEVREPERLNGIEMEVRTESLARISF